MKRRVLPYDISQIGNVETRAKYSKRREMSFYMMERLNAPKKSLLSFLECGLRITFQNDRFLCNLILHDLTSLVRLLRFWRTTTPKAKMTPQEQTDAEERKLSTVPNSSAQRRKTCSSFSLATSAILIWPLFLTSIYLKADPVICGASSVHARKQREFLFRSFHISPS